MDIGGESSSSHSSRSRKMIALASMVKYSYIASNFSAPKIKDFALNAMEVLYNGSSAAASYISFAASKVMEKMVTPIYYAVKNTHNDDTRRVTFALKVATVVAIISILYFVDPLYNMFRMSANLAALIDIFVMDFTVGETVVKLLNRTLAALLANVLGFGLHKIAVSFGHIGEPIFLEVIVFLVVFGVTFSRFIPVIKSSCKYCVMLFMMTFILEAVASYREEEVLVQRFYTIVIEVVLIFTSALVFPVWAGNDLHKRVANNLDNLATSLEGLGRTEYFERNVVISENLETKSFLQGLLDAKAEEEYLAKFARWELLRHTGQFRFNHPWREYLKVASLSHDCASSINVVCTSIPAFTRTETTTDSEFHTMFGSACAEMSSESAKALSDLASSIRNMTVPLAASIHITNALTAARKINTGTVPASFTECNFSDIKMLGSAGMQLTEVVNCTLKITKAVHELAHTAQFRKPIPEPQAQPQSVSRGRVYPVADGESPGQEAIDMDQLAMLLSRVHIY